TGKQPLLILFQHGTRVSAPPGHLLHLLASGTPAFWNGSLLASPGNRRFLLPLADRSFLYLLLGRFNRFCFGFLPGLFCPFILRLRNILRSYRFFLFLERLFFIQEFLFFLRL